VLDVAEQVADEVWIGLSDRPWRGEKLPPDRTESFILPYIKHERRNVHLLRGSWAVEEDHINSIIMAALEYEKAHSRDPYKGDTWYWYLDADEIYTLDQIREAKAMLTVYRESDAVMVQMATYFRHGNWIVTPPEPLTPRIFFRIKPGFKIVNIRHSNPLPQRELLLPRSMCVMHHPSYVATDEEMKSKIESFSHSHEFVPQWYERVWKGGTLELHNFHPTHPPMYRSLQRLDPATLPAEMTKYPEMLLLDTVEV